jgi:hypothetical protein
MQSEQAGQREINPDALMCRRLVMAEQKSARED